MRSLYLAAVLALAAPAAHASPSVIITNNAVLTPLADSPAERQERERRAAEEAALRSFAEGVVRDVVLRLERTRLGEKADPTAAELAAAVAIPDALAAGLARRPDPFTGCLAQGGARVVRGGPVAFTGWTTGAHGRQGWATVEIAREHCSRHATATLTFDVLTADDGRRTLRVVGYEAVGWR